jgi:hypothetical protein
VQTALRPLDHQALVVSVLVTAVLIAAARPAGATVILPADFAEMVAGSQLIVHGRVVEVRSQLTAGRRTIESVITVDVMEYLKGSAGRSVAFRMPNGQVGRYRRLMVGAADFAAGDEVVLFLKGRPPAIPMPFGLSQGIYRVTRRNGQPVVTQPPLQSGTVGGGPLVRGDPARRPLAMVEFARQVQALAEPAR